MTNDKRPILFALVALTGGAAYAFDGGQTAAGDATAPTAQQTGKEAPTPPGAPGAQGTAEATGSRSQEGQKGSTEKKPEAAKTQEPKKVEDPEVTFEDLWPSGNEGEAQAQQEIAELFDSVERRLRLIDAMLLEASAGNTTRLAELEGSGLEDLLEDLPQEQKPKSDSESSCQGLGGSIGQSSTQGRQAVEEINRIIEIAQSLPSGCQAGAPKEGEKPGQSPLDRPQTSRDKSQSPEKPKEDGSKPGEKPKEPKDNKSSEDEGKNEKADRIPGAATETPPQVTDQREHWGDLPVHVRDVFRAEGGPGMPAQYRDWIDAYYRRLNSRSGD